jgi:hypothetical protein
MIQQPSYSIGARYIRVRETGSVFPDHPEQLKVIKKDLADLVEWNGTQFVRVELGSLPAAAPVKIVSTPARKPEPATPPPVVQRTFAPPGQGPSAETFEAPAPADVADPAAALAAAAAAAAVVTAPPVAPQPVAAPANPGMPPITKTVIAPKVDLTIDAPPEA